MSVPKNQSITTIQELSFSCNMTRRHYIYKAHNNVKKKKFLVNKVLQTDQ